jgi:hypothetical protein
MTDQLPASPEKPELKATATADVKEALAEVSAEQAPRKPTPLAERQEETRGVLAKNLIGILRLVVVFLLCLIVIDRIAASTFAFYGKKYEYSSTESKDIATLILTSLSGLVGTALGFYFGSKSFSNTGGRED